MEFLLLEISTDWPTYKGASFSLQCQKLGSSGAWCPHMVRVFTLHRSMVGNHMVRETVLAQGSCCEAVNAFPRTSPHPVLIAS